MRTTVQNLVSQAVSSETEKDATNVLRAALNKKANAVTPEAMQTIMAAATATEKKPLDEACKTLVGSREIAEGISRISPCNNAADVKRVIDSILVKDVKEARDSVVREVNTRRGTQNEHKGIATYEKSNGVKLHGKNSKFYQKIIGKTSLGTPVSIGGRVDGFTGDKVVEIKCRRNHLFNTLPLYEKVQTQAYLFLTGKNTVEVLQKYDGATRADNYAADAHFWNNVCEAALKFASDLEIAISTT